MITEKEILDYLDNYRNGYDSFITLSHPYVFPVLSRLNLFRSENDEWAIACELFGYDTCSEPIAIEIKYFGNCLINLEKHDDYFLNSYNTFPVSEESYNDTIEFGALKTDAKYWKVRDTIVELSHDKEDYTNVGIKLLEIEPNEISVEEVARLLITKHEDLFRATNEELYKSIPRNLKKILVIDEWFHKDCTLENPYTEKQLPDEFNLLYNAIEEVETRPKENRQQFFDTLKNMGVNVDENENLNEKNISEELKEGDERAIVELENTKPSSYETWQMIAKVLATGDTSYYNPTLKPSSHWRNWPNAGYM